MTPIAHGSCGHDRAEPGYRPSRGLQHLVKVRNARCTAPGCGRPASRCDLDHTQPWDQGGLTCECDLADRDTWPWLPGSIVKQCGPDEWYVCIEVRDLAVLSDGRRAPRGTASRNLYYPCCFRDGSEIRPRTASSSATSSTRRGAAR